MIDMGMFAALGFLVASLLALMLAPPLWHRAVRLTTRRIEATMPMSVVDIQADKDQLRAEFAIALRRVEVALEKAKDKAARELVESNKRRVEIVVLKEELATVKGRVQENENANRVLEQTIRRRLPDLESRIKAAKGVIAELEAANGELRNTVGSQSAALKEARGALQSQRSDIEGLRGALEGGGRVLKIGKSDAELAKENQRLNAELSRLKEAVEQERVIGEENELLRQELSKLAQQILGVARAQAHAVVEDIAAPPSIASHRHEPQGTQAHETAQAHEAAQAREPAFHAGNGSGTSELAAAEESVPEPPPRAEEMEAVPDQSVPDQSVPDESVPGEATQDEGEPRGGLARRLAYRRAKRRALKGSGQSLTERLKDIPAEASEPS